MEKLFIELEGLRVEVKVVDKRTKFGFNQYLVIPVAGSGEKWVNEASILKGVKNKLIKNV